MNPEYYFNGKFSNAKALNSLWIINHEFPFCISDTSINFWRYFEVRNSDYELVFCCLKKLENIRKICTFKTHVERVLKHMIECHINEETRNRNYS